MSVFHDVRLPLSLSRGAKLSIEHASEIVTLASGREVRNARWSQSRRTWNIAGAISSKERLNALIAFFEARRGPLHAFRFRDDTDFSSNDGVPTATDQQIGAGTGVQRSFALIKAAGETVRKITKPVAETVRVSVGGAETSAFSADPATGLVTLDAPPPEGADIRAGFLFDVPVRFAAPSLDITLDACLAGRAPSISLIEVRE